ncbi:MAG: hypothetical protein AB7I41_11705 [Candidatus Sericytochromatia bacterium]
MMIRKTLSAAFSTAMATSLLLLTACGSQLPLQNAALAPRQIQAASINAPINAMSTNGALNLIEEMAHAEDPAQYAQIEAAFRVEIAKSTRPSLQKIVANAIEAIEHHPIPGGDITQHPVARLIYASLERYVKIMSKNLVGRMMLIFDLANVASPAEQEAKLQKIQRSLNALPKMDAKDLLELLQGGFFKDEVAPGSPVEARLQKMLQERLVARF